MNSQLNLLNAVQKQREMQRGAAARRRATRAAAAPSSPGETEIHLTVRLADARDGDSVRRLAELEGRPIPGGALLMGIVDNVAVAALPVSGGPAIADPFRPSVEVVDRLREARAHLRGGGRPGKRARISAAIARLFGEDSPPRGVRAPAVPGSERFLIR